MNRLAVTTLTLTLAGVAMGLSIMTAWDAARTTCPAPSLNRAAWIISTE